MSNPDKIKCKLCGKELMDLTNHVRVHGITKEDYLILFPNSLLMSPKLLAKKVQIAKKHFREFNKTERASQIRLENGIKMGKAGCGKYLTNWVKKNPKRMAQIRHETGVLTAKKHHPLSNWQKSVSKEVLSEHARKACLKGLKNRDRKEMARIAIENYHYLKYPFYSKRFGLDRVLKSSWEVKFVEICEKSTEIQSLVYEPFQLPYNFKGNVHYYTPDFLLNYKDQYFVIEVKPRNHVENIQILAKIIGALKYCELKDYYFAVVTEHILFSKDKNSTNALLPVLDLYL